MEEVRNLDAVNKMFSSRIEDALEPIQNIEELEDMPIDPESNKELTPEQKEKELKFWNLFYSGKTKEALKFANYTYKPWRRVYLKPDGTEFESKRPLQRNELCPCGSGKKVKNCCGIKSTYLWK